MKTKIFIITLFLTFIFFCSCNKNTIAFNYDKNKNEKNGLSKDTIKPNGQNFNKFQKLYQECREIPNGYKLVSIDQMHHFWKNYLNIPSPNYFESDLNGDKKEDFVFTMIDSNMLQSLICVFLSNENIYNYYIIDSAVTFENKNQIIIYPNNDKIIKTLYDTYSLNFTSINSMLIWESLDYTYFWNTKKFEKIMYD